MAQIRREITRLSSRSGLIALSSCARLAVRSSAVRRCGRSLRRLCLFAWVVLLDLVHLWRQRCK